MKLLLQNYEVTSTDYGFNEYFKALLIKGLVRPFLLICIS